MSFAANKQILADYKFRHFLLFSKARAEASPGRALQPSLSDAEIRELMECMWMAERIQRNPGVDLRAERSAYRLADWVTRDLSEKALAQAMENAFEVFSALPTPDPRKLTDGQPPAQHALQLELS